MTAQDKQPAAETLRRLADRYQILADDYEAIGRYAEAESNRRLVRDCLVAAVEVESRLAQLEALDCQDGTEEFPPNVVCRGCGRVLMKDGTWVYPSVEPDFLGSCPSCMHLEQERQRLMGEVQLRRTRALLRKKLGLAEGDVFKGMGEES